MKAKINLLLLLALLAEPAISPDLKAQTFTVLHSFTNSDGAIPAGAVTLSGDTLYGTAQSGGSSGNGTVFAVNTDGNGFRVLHDFTQTFLATNPSDSFGIYSTNTDGTQPQGGLVLSGDTLYGTAQSGGDYGVGTVFALNTAGTPFKTLHNLSFNPEVNADGANPNGNLALLNNTLYGTAINGGAGNGYNGFGTVFSINTNGSGFANLYDFQGYPNDGSFPTAGVIASIHGVYSDYYGTGYTLYGTASAGGPDGPGGAGTLFTVFPFPGGTYYELTMHQFTFGDDGGRPNGTLAISSDYQYLYGTAYGGTNGVGTVFAMKNDFTGFKNLYAFAATRTNSLGVATNSDGTVPAAGLLLSGNTLYGTASGGGANGSGTVFAINTDGTGFMVPHSFAAIHTNSLGVAANSDGVDPSGSLVLANNTLYGTTECRRQRGPWHGVQPCVVATFAATDHHAFRDQCCSDVAGQCHRVHIGIRDQSGLAGGLERGCSRPGCHRRAKHRDQSHFQLTEVLPLNPITTRSGNYIGP